MSNVTVHRFKNQNTNNFINMNSELDSSSSMIFHPIISSIQRVALYETKVKLYLIGSNNTQTRFRVLQIDRQVAGELSIIDDKIEYGSREIHDLLRVIDLNNGPRGPPPKVVSAFGIVGFVRFLQGYYVVLITARRRVAIVGLHTIYKVEDTCVFPVSNDQRTPQPHEQRYVKMFQNIDLSSNFYFSYSYDLTRSLQNNMAPPRHIIPRTFNSELQQFCKSNADEPKYPPLFTCNSESKNQEDHVEYAVRNYPRMRYVWNTHLLQPVEGMLHPDWLLHITHGFVDQSNMSIFGRPVYVTIIARRSTRFAGTRFLKRGANFCGDVANEVETEQLVHDTGVSTLSEGRFSSFVQMRGSIPGHWSQDISKMVPKPLISLDLSDPYGETSGAHFNRLLADYGAPIIILNLVKKREKRKHESILSEEMSSAVKYLNQFLPPQQRIQYVHFDMARKNRAKVAGVMSRLANIAKAAILQTGMYVSGSKRQTGVIRVNCVDCLDRTNTAQFAIGKSALGFQLVALGLLDSPELEFDSDCVRMLEGLYEDHGDTLALQYGGSQLVHRIKTYRKTAPWTSQGNDIVQTVSRYYSNTFSDAEKQHTINLFLGYFVPEEGQPPIWEIPTDFYMHNPQATCLTTMKSIPITQWWDRAVLECLPNAYNDFNKSVMEMIRVHSREIEMLDVYADYHRPHELTVLSEMFAYKVSHSVRDFMPNFTTNYSPFAVRVRPGRRREGGPGATTNPSLTGQSSTGSTASSTSSSEDVNSSSDEDSPWQEVIREDAALSESNGECKYPRAFKDVLPSMGVVYGSEPKRPNAEDLMLYKQYVTISRREMPQQYKYDMLYSKLDSIDEQSKIQPTMTVLPKSRKITPTVRIVPYGDLSGDSMESVTPPVVPEKSIELYRKHVALAQGSTTIKPSANDLILYRKYAAMIK